LLDGDAWYFLNLLDGDAWYFLNLLNGDAWIFFKFTWMETLDILYRNHHH
jgi:hypothetical protein